MARNMHVTFFGTSSGGGPSISRNCSSLVADVVGDGSLWMVDCAEGTVRQFQTQPRGNNIQGLRAQRVNKLFVTHMHADHVVGIVPFLRHILYPPPISGSSEVQPSSKLPPRIELYGPAGLRNFVRSILTMTLSRTADTYAVHELLTPSCTPTPCYPSLLHPSECHGLDFMCDEGGFWRSITSASGHLGEVIMDAGPITHRDPCIGYVIHERSFPQRKLAILGDTCDPSAIIPLLSSPPPSLLVHEATDAFIPRSVDVQARRKSEDVHEKVLARGHSTPVMAGEFAKRVGAQRLVLNHIGSRFPAPRQLKDGRDRRFAVIEEIGRQASEAWGMGRAEVAFDYMRVSIPAPAMAETTVVAVEERVEMTGEEEERESAGGEEAEAGRCGKRGRNIGRGRGRNNQKKRKTDY